MIKLAEFDGDITLTFGIDASDAIETSKDLQSHINDIFKKTSSKELTKQFNNVKRQLDKVNTSVERTRQDMEDLANTKVGNTKQYDIVIEKIKDWDERVQNLRKNILKSTDGSIEQEQLMSQLKQAQSVLDYWERQKVELERSGDAYLMGIDTEKYQQLAERLGELNNRMRVVISSAYELDESEKAAADGTQLLGEATTDTSTAMQRFIQGVIRGAIGFFSILAEHIKNAAHTLIGIFIKGVDGATSGLKKLGKVAGKAVLNFGKFIGLIGGKMLGLNKAGNIFHKIASSITGITKSASKGLPSFKKLLAYTLKWGLGIRSLFILWRKLRAYTTDALKLMATQFAEVDADVSALMNSFNQMKLSFGTMAQPLMHALRPALIYIIELITRATNALANFFAILTGQKFIYKAQKANDSYADSIKGVGGAAKEANKELAEYDNLLVIDQPKDSGGGGGGGAADGLTGTFEKTLAESDFARQLKEAINRGDWEGVGGLFANKLNIITKTFDDWINDKFRPAGVKWANRIARIFNGLTEGWDSKLTGKTIADGLNAVLDTANTFFKTYKFKRLGEKVGGLIKGFFDNMEPKLVGETFANKINAAIDFATGLIDTTPWEEIGDKLGVAVKTWIDTIKWEDFGSDLQKLASGLLTSLSHFIETSQLGTTVGTAINRFLSNIDFGQFAKDLSKCAENILDALADVIITIDWKRVGEAIADFLANIDWLKLIEKLGKVALALLAGLAEAISGLATNPKALGVIATAFATIFGAKLIWGKVKSVFSEGLGTALSGAVGDNGLWGKIKGLFKKNTTTAVTEGVSEATSDSGAVAQTSSACNGFLTKAVAGIAAYEIGGKIGADLVSGIASALGASDEYIEEVKKFGEAPITYTAKALKETFTYAFEDSTKGIPDAIEMLAKEINQAMLQGTIDYQGVMDKIQEVPEKYRDTLIQVADETQATLDKIHQNQQKFGNDTVETTEKMNASWSDYADNYNKTTKEVEADNKNIEKSFYTMTDYIPPAVKEAMEQTADNIEDALEPVPGTVANINSAFAPLPNDLGATSASALQSVQTNFATDALTGHFTTVKDNIETPFKSLPSFFSDTFKQSWNEAESAFSSGNTTFNNFNAKLSEGMTNTINNLIGGLNSAVSRPLQKIQEVINKFKNVKIGASALFSNLPSFSNIPSIPKLAQGAVIPPNREFLAMLGDQTNGTNIETPLETMVQAFKSALSEMSGSSTNQNIVLQLDGRTVAQCVWDEEDKRYKQTGRR